MMPNVRMSGESLVAQMNRERVEAQRAAYERFAASGGWANLSATQRRLLLWLAKDQCHRQVAGHGMAKWLSAGNALIRRGLAYSHKTGKFGLTKEGRALAANVEHGHQRNDLDAAMSQQKK